VPAFFEEKRRYKIKLTMPQTAPIKKENMNNLNPLIPQGSLLEQKAKGKPHLRVAYIIVAIHLVFLGGLLIQGCKRDDKSGTTSGQATNDTTLPPLNQDALYHAASNALTTNLTQQDLVTTNPPLAATQTQGVSSSIVEIPTTTPTR